MNNKPYTNKSKFIDILWLDKEKKQIEFICKIKKRYLGNKKIILIDAACGTGRLSKKLLNKANIKRIVCYDSSEDMIKYAKKKIKTDKISFYKASLGKFTPSIKAEIIICMYTSFNYLLNDRDIESTLFSFNKSLVKGGIVVLDLANLFYFAMYGDKSRTLEFNRQNAKINQIIKNSYNPFDNLWISEETIFYQEGSKISRINEKHLLRYITFTEIKFFCKKTKFKIKDIFFDYSLNKELNSGRIIFILQKSK